MLNTLPTASPLECVILAAPLLTRRSPGPAIVIHDQWQDIGRACLGVENMVLQKNNEMTQMWGEAEQLIHETGYTIDEGDSDKCSSCNATGMKLNRSTPQGADKIKILGHTMTRNTGELNKTTRITSAKKVFNSLRKFLTRTQAPPWILSHAFHIVIGPTATWRRQHSASQPRQPHDSSGYGARWCDIHCGPISSLENKKRRTTSLNDERIKRKPTPTRSPAMVS